MSLKIVCAGKMKERDLVGLSSEYVKRLSRYSPVEIIEVQDEPIPDRASEAECLAILKKEGKRLLSHVSPADRLIALTIDGTAYSSEEFAEHLESLAVRGVSRLVFAIGGSLGLSSEVTDRADETLSLSRMTLPHRLARIFLLEQIYRTFKIRSNETYHK